MIRTRVGYTGGTTKNPTYRTIGDHSEAIQIDFDPAVITYDELLAVFWGDHNPCGGQWSTQYKNVLFYHDADQKRRAESSRDRLAKNVTRAITTEIVAAGTFYRAEDYHQKYYLRRSRPLTQSVRALAATETAFVDSTAAARINGYLGGHVTYDRLREQLTPLGIITRGERRLETVAPRPAAAPKTAAAGSERPGHE